MDLRPFQLPHEQVLEGAALLDYQPFILSEDVQTGIAYDWLHGQQDPGRYVAYRDQVSEETWQRFTIANSRLRTMYDEWVEAACSHVHRGQSVLDIACNSGYFLQQFARKGYPNCVGYDMLDKSRAFGYLNRVLDTNAIFIHKRYDSWSHQLPGCNPADIVVASAILLHLSDPLYFLHFLGGVTRKALLLFTRVIRTDDYLIRYEKPNAYYKQDPFPVCFDNNNSISTGLLELSLRKVGFREIVELPRNDGWIPASVMDLMSVYLCLK